MYDELLVTSGLSNKELASKLGIHPGTLSNRKSDPPQYVVAFLIEYNRAKELDELKAAMYKVVKWAVRK